ncbi:hypothetical protein [Mucisphaera sp.]|uniref:hypothetical protein n=1 Tax=Mucisphaera sp. TaxID=2913024 RepID=UPI003D152D12
MKSSGLRCGVLVSAYLAGAMGASAGGAVKSFDGSVSDVWGEAGNWTPFGLPLSGDDVFIGNLAGVENQFVTLDVDDTVASLTITDGIALNTDGHRLLVSGTTTVSGENGPINNTVWPSRIQVRPVAGGLPGLDTDVLVIEDEASVSIGNPIGDELGLLEVDVLLDVKSTSGVGGKGLIRLRGNGSRSLINDGAITARPEGLTITQLGTGLIDLDGVSGQGEIFANVSNGSGEAGKVTVNGTGLWDWFNGEIRLTRGSLLDMNLTNGWTTGSGSLVRVTGGGSSADPAEIAGGLWTLEGGTLEVTGNDGRAVVTADAVIEPGVFLNVGIDDDLEFDGEADIRGGTYSLAEGARLTFDGPTTISGGQFNMEAFSSEFENRVAFHDVTSWQGDATFSGGAVLQLDDAAVLLPTTIDAGVIDMDGFSITEWVVTSEFVVNADRIDVLDQKFDGRIEIGGGLSSRATINLSDPSDSWRMDGELALIGNQLGFVTRLAGSEVDLTGDLFPSFNSQITADFNFLGGSLTSWRSAFTRLRMQGKTEVMAGANFIGGGTLVNGVDGEMVIEPGMDFGDSSLENEGVMRVGSGVGQVSTAGFVQEADAVLKMQVFGSGENAFDRLFVQGEVEVAGVLELQVPGAGFLTYGTVIPLIDGLSRVGEFDEVVGQVVASDFALAVVYPEDAVWAIVALPGDADLDGDVDLVDLSILASNFEEGGTWTDANFNGDDVVDLIDLSLLATNFGTDLGMLPEPSGAVLLGLGAAGVLRRRVA